MPYWQLPSTAKLRWTLMSTRMEAYVDKLGGMEEILTRLLRYFEISVDFVQGPLGSRSERVNDINSMYHI